MAAWPWKVFNTQWSKVYCCWEIYQDPEDKNLHSYWNVKIYVYIDKLDEIVDKCNNTYYRTTKTKPTVVKPGTYILYGCENNDKDPKFKVSNHVENSK